MKKFSTNKLLKDLYRCICIADDTDADAIDILMSCYSELRYLVGKDLDGDTPEKNGEKVVPDDFLRLVVRLRYATCFCGRDSRLEKMIYKVAAQLENKVNKAGV